MKLSFGHKLFLAFLANSLVIVVCMLLFARYFAHRDFEEYIGKVEIERLDQLASVLGEEYRQTGSWDTVLAGWGDWLRVISMRPGRPPTRPSTASGAGSPPFFPPPGPPPFAAGKVPWEGHPPPPGAPPLHPPGPPPGEGFLPLPGPPPGPREITQSIALFDAQKRSLTGPEHSSAESYRLRPITVEAKTVGWLGHRRPEHLTHPLALEFIRRQSQTFYSIGGVALLLALLVTLVLSRRLLSPVKKLAEGTRALTLRKFETRIAVKSRDELGQLAADFNAMAQALEKHEQMRRQWIADISHELRTPIAILRGEIEAMQDGVREITPEALASLHFEVLHVGRIVQDLHELSLIESETTPDEQTPLDPLEILEETLESFHTRFEQRGLMVDTLKRDGRKAFIAADPNRLKQLFSNVFENTLRYADAPGVLKIRHEIAAGSICLHIEDSGPGVPEESVGRLFDRLYRVDKARGRAQGGSGLGLAICRGIVERFGGRIEAVNVKPEGLRISITFPVIPD
ncbi:MAG: ATP-binding protein [Syntrophobacteraceae bacterium]